MRPIGLAERGCNDNYGLHFSHYQMDFFNYNNNETKGDIVMDEQLEAALWKVLDYLWIDELGDYAGESDHIFVHLATIRNALIGGSRSPAEWKEE